MHSLKAVAQLLTIEAMEDRMKKIPSKLEVAPYALKMLSG